MPRILNFGMAKMTCCSAMLKLKPVKSMQSDFRFNSSFSLSLMLGLELYLIAFTYLKALVFPLVFDLLAIGEMVEFLKDDASFELISKLPPDIPLSSF